MDKKDGGEESQKRFFKNRRLNSQRKQNTKTNKSLSKSMSMLSNSIYGLDQGQNIMGILNFIEVANPYVDLDDLRNYLMTKFNEKNN